MSGSQKFIARNRAPRVQIEYDVELYGAEKKVQLPFVMGVMSDLSGKSNEKQPSIADRKFLEIDVDNFDDRMKSMKPRVEFSVPNTLTGEGNLPVDITFEKMSDFSPAAIARKIEPLRKLLEARTQLSNLTAYMDGKTGAEDLIQKLVSDPTLLKALGGGAAIADTDLSGALASLKGSVVPEIADPRGEDAVLDSLRARAPVDEVADTGTDDVLSSLRDTAPVETTEPDTTADALDALRSIAPNETPDTEDATADVLAALRDAAPEDEAEDDGTDDTLAALRDAAPEDEAEDDGTDDTLAALRDAAPEDEAEDDGTDDALAALRDAAPGDEAEDDGTDDTLAALRDAAPEDEAEDDGTDDALAALRDAAPGDEAEDDGTDDTLAALRDAAPEDEAEDDGTDDTLAALRDAAPGDEAEDDGTDDTLAALRDAAPEDEAEDDGTDDTLAALRDAAPGDEAEDDGTDDALAALRDAAPEDEAEDDGTDDALAALRDAAPGDEAEDDGTDDTLAALRDAAPEDEAEDDGTDDTLAALRDAAPEDEAEDDGTDDTLAALRDAAPEDEAEDDGTDDALAALRDAAPGDEAEDDGTDDTLAALRDAAPEDEAEDDGTDDALAALRDAAPGDEAEDDGTDDTLAALRDAAPGDEAEDDGTDDTLAALRDAAEDDGDDDLEALLADDDAPGGDDLEALLADDDAPGGDDLDSLLGDLGDDLAVLLAEDSDDGAEASAEDDALAALLADDDLIEEDDATEDDDVDLEALLAGTDDVDLDSLLGPDDDTETVDTETADTEALDTESAGDSDDENTEEPAVPDEIDDPFGTMSAPRPIERGEARKSFRIAILGDFTGRGNRGAIETGADLAKRRAIPFDIDTVEDVIESFATTLVLPIGKDGSAIEVKLGGLDDLHPDELYENVSLFEELSGLRQRVSMGSMSASAIADMQGWGEEFGKLDLRAASRSKSAAVPVNLKMTDFQSLIGDSEGTLATPSAAEDLIQRIVAPHVVAAPDPEQSSMLAALDSALSSSMRTILHHPDFQAVESTWRSLDLLARRIETDEKVSITLYDISAEELGADLAAEEDLAESGLYRLLGEIPFEEEGPGGYSAVFGLYTFEETPPHAELLSRLSKVCAHIDAPFFGAITPGFLEVAKQDRHPLVAKAWDSLRKQPAAKYIGLASPRFLLRLPYGAKSEPIDPFDFEEFTMREGLRGMLWANPVVLVAILLAKTARAGGKNMSLGTITAMDDMPFHFVTDSYGDQVALPCTERLLNTTTSAHAVARGYMPVLSVKGRNEVRLGSWQGLGGGEIMGVWAGNTHPEKQESAPVESDTAQPEAGDSDDMDTDDLDLDLDTDSDGDDDDLDSLLAGFDDADSEDDDDDDMDAELAALLGDL